MEQQRTSAWMDQEYLTSRTKSKPINGEEMFKPPAEENDDEGDNDKEKQVFGIVIRDCPKSLKLFLQFYRIFGYSFSGLCFDDDEKESVVLVEDLNNNQKTTTEKTTKNQCKKGHKTSFYCTTFLLYHIALITGALFTIYISQTAYVLPTSAADNNNASSLQQQHNISNLFEYEIKLGIQQFRHGFDDFKPILRTILQSVVRVFTLNALANFVLNLFTGGRLIREIVLARTANFDNSEKLDGCSRSLAVKVILGLILSILTVNIFSLVAFNWKLFNSVLALLIPVQSWFGWKFSAEEEFIAKQVLLLMVFHMLLYVIEMMVTLLFGYTMFMFKRHIELLQEQVRTNANVSKFKIDEEPMKQPTPKKQSQPKTPQTAKVTTPQLLKTELLKQLSPTTTKTTTTPADPSAPEPAITVKQGPLIPKSITTTATTVTNEPAKTTTVTVDGANEIIPELPPGLKNNGYELLRKIGDGGFSVVYLATNNRLPGVQLACKVFSLTELHRGWQEKFLKQEMKLMTKLRHRNICCAYDVYKTRSKGYIFMKYASNGGMEAYTARHYPDGRLPETPITRKFFFALMGAVEYLHALNVAHRDLKVENFLLDEELEPLITDFGFSVLGKSDAEGPVICDTICGSSMYIAPEVRMLKTTPLNTNYDAKKADIYSMGVCLYEMLHGHRPFEGQYDIRSKELARRQMASDYHINSRLHLTKNCQAVIIQLLEPKVARRPSARGVLRHAWFTGLSRPEAQQQQKKQGCG